VNGNDKAYDEIISTIPIPYIPKIIPDLPGDILQQFSEIHNVAVICVIAKLKQAVSPFFWVNVNDRDMDIPGFVEYSNLMPMEHSIVYVPFYMPQNQNKFKDNDDVFIRKVKSYLMQINLKLSNDDFLDFHVSRYLYSQPVCPPQFLNILPPINCRIQGLKVADTSYYYPEDRGISESFKFAKSRLS
jgi:protoporphyrinogen oxidase